MNAAPPSSGAGAIAAPATVRLNPLRLLAALAMLGAGIAVMVFAMSGRDSANTDFVSYWAAGQQLVHHSNPYDPIAVERMERSVGCTRPRTVFMRNPPLAFFLVAPLGLVSERTGAILWALSSIAALMASIRLLWMLYGRRNDGTNLLGYLFTPVLACILGGQTSTFLLLGVVLFLYCHQTRPFLAGSALLLCSLKPHLFLPFGVVLLAWIATRRAYRLLMGSAAALCASILLGMTLDPAGWSHYSSMLRSESIQNEFIPTISFFLRCAIDPQAVWLQLVLAVIGSAWALWYFWSNRVVWEWTDHGSRLLLVSVLVAPYAWFSDEAVVLPAILGAIYRARPGSKALIIFAIMDSITLGQFFSGVAGNTGWYAWTAPAWLLWYVFAVRGASSATQESHRVLGLSLIASPEQ